MGSYRYQRMYLWIELQKRKGQKSNRKPGVQQPWTALSSPHCPASPAFVNRRGPSTDHDTCWHLSFGGVHSFVCFILLPCISFTEPLCSLVPQVPGVAHQTEKPKMRVTERRDKKNKKQRAGEEERRLSPFTVVKKHNRLVQQDLWICVALCH